MIVIHASPTADTRTCDWSKVTKEQLLASSVQHIGDIRAGLKFFQDRLEWQANLHDHDKLSDIDGFHRDFATGFKQRDWWDNHRKVNRHHLTMEDGIPENVDLIDVLDFIVDCVMAGMARSGSVYDLHLPPELLERAFQNTVAMLKHQVKVEPATADKPAAEVCPNCDTALPEGCGGLFKDDGEACWLNRSADNPSVSTPADISGTNTGEVG